jgi:uncharacterized protein
MRPKALVDSSFLYAAYSKGDTNHQVAINFLVTTDLALIVPDVILPEVAFLFLRDVGQHGVEQFLGKFSATRLVLQDIIMDDLQRAHEIMQTYPDAKFDLVDTCIMALSERLQITKICTFDRRDFSIFRPKHCDYLELLP